MILPKKRATADAVEILKREFIDGKPEMEAMFDRDFANLLIGREIYQLRMKHKLSRKSLAAEVGISAYAVRQLEEACYSGAAAEMLKRVKKVCRQLNKRMRVG